VLVNASKKKTRYVVQTKDTVLLSGKHSVQSNPNAGRGWTYSCFGSESDILSLMGMIGTSHTLVIGSESFAKCYIDGDVEIQESDNPNWVEFTVTFVQDTTT